MSFDLAVFRGKGSLDDRKALGVYEALCSTKREKEARAALETNARIEAFHRALTAEYPELGDDEDESPFAADIERRPYALIMNISFSRADEVAARVEQLARKHDLDVFDPQARRLVRASDAAAKRPVPQAKLSPKDGLALFVAGIGPRLEALNFAPTPKVKHAWSRTLPNGVIHEIGLNLGTREVRPDVAVGTEQALAWLWAATGKREPLPRMGLEYLYFRGWIPKEPWRDEEGEQAFNHEICHRECVEKSVARFAAEIARYAVPFFGALGTTDAIADFFARSTPFSKARPNWTIDRESALGPAVRFWRPDRALLLELAAGALFDPKSTKSSLSAATKRATTWREKALHGASPELAGQIEALGRAIASSSSPATIKAAKDKTKPLARRR